jgi:hypothetical protein
VSAEKSFLWMNIIKRMASDKNHRPCLPLKPQEKSLLTIYSIINLSVNSTTVLKISFDWKEFQ